MSALFVEPWHVEEVSECHFYHTMELPGLGVIPGHVDLRPNATAYLGNVALNGRRVLEFGPASGFLSFYMENAGAREVVGLEVSEAVVWNLVPQPDLNQTAIRQDRREHMRKIKCGFWLAHRLLGSSTRMVYGNATHPPAELGRFDLAVLGGVLLHCRDPLQVLQVCADSVDEAIVITEQEILSFADADRRPLQWLAPSRENQIWDVWWRFTPGLFVQALPLYGFPNVTISRHDQLSLGKAYTHFTVVGRR